MKDLSKYRQEFPHLKTDQLYLDHAAVSPMNLRTKRAIETYIDERSNEKINNYMATLDKMDQLREKFGQIVHGDSKRIAIVQNTTDGFALLARGYPWRDGDRIILHQQEFPSNVYPWYDLKPFGVEIDFVRSPLGIVTPDDLEPLVTDRTVLLAVSWVQYLSGYRNNIAELSEWCHQNDILLVVDAMQGLGALEFRQDEWKADFVSSGTAKWLMGIQGVGFIYINEELQGKIHPPHLGWHSRKSFFDFHNYDQPLKPNADRYEFATPSSPGIWGTDEAIGLLLEVGIDDIENRILALADRLADGIESAGLKLYTDRYKKESNSGIVTFLHEDESRNTEIHKQLAENRITISLRENLLRVSPHFYNTFDEMDEFLSALHNQLN